MNPADLYGAHKAEAEQHIRSSNLEWVILRLGGVISVEPEAMPFSVDALFFESALPTDGRIHTVDVRDVARAFTAATTADVVGETLLIAGDESHRIRQGEVGKALAAARGLVDVLPGDARVIPTTTTTGSSPTGWIPLAPNRPCDFSITPGRTCSTRCARRRGGGATRCG